MDSRSYGRHRFRAEAGLSADVDLVELLLGQAVRLGEVSDVRADDRQQESDRDADDADVLQRERGVCVDRDGPSWADGYKPDRDQRPADQGCHGTPRVEPLPE